MILLLNIKNLGKKRKKAKNNKERKYEKRFLSFYLLCIYVFKATKKEEAIYIITSVKAIFITTSTNVTI